MLYTQSPFLPTTLTDVRERNWENLDVILVTGDAYIDHPSFGVSIIGRYLESLDVKVGIIAAPNIYRNEDFTSLGRPNWFFGVTSGNLDSMLMYHTASKKYRSNDDYVPRHLTGQRPKRAIIAYCNKIRELFEMPGILIGGIEASLRRVAHYDYWDNKVRRSILFDSRADLLVYGMGEAPLKEIVTLSKKGIPIKDMKNIRGTASILDSERLSKIKDKKNTVALPSFEEVKEDVKAYTKSSRIIHENHSPYKGKALLQSYDKRLLLVNPPSYPLSIKEMDNIYNLPFTRKPHYIYKGKGKIPAFEMIKTSVTIMRGCFGGCSFCSLSMHQGKEIQIRSKTSISREINKISKMNDFSGYISDLGGPTANMYGLGCSNEKIKKNCRKISCLHPRICINLITDHTKIIELLRATKQIKNIKKVFIASGIRFDLANRSPEYIKELAQYHTSGQLKVAPEHYSPNVLEIMKKPSISEYEIFKTLFLKESQKAGLKQFIVPYFISSHPGCGLKEQFSLALYLKKNNIRPRQIQEFIPLPMTLSGDIYYTGIDPLSGRKILTAKDERLRVIQKKLLLYYKPENINIIRIVRKMI